MIPCQIHYTGCSEIVPALRIMSLVVIYSKSQQGVYSGVCEMFARLLRPKGSGTATDYCFYKVVPETLND